MIDDRLSFNSHIHHVFEKAVKGISTLSRIMPNNSAINSSKKRLLAGPAWVTVLQAKRNTTRLNSMFRLMVMRVLSAYRTISSEAVYMIAGIGIIGIEVREKSVNKIELIS
ncbi:uncharacterized protein LOC131693767 [Topomyia yanbarensis]|uniref:uncharacterized protein LOC131693767 n=1 Tax=Topomyia yanbarensis TaxID=2498891 RepID=UPI00273C5717|nr:uncharacterized protein LOC131693767 [Topomyia yanbarensis]